MDWGSVRAVAAPLKRNRLSFHFDYCALLFSLVLPRPDFVASSSSPVNLRMSVICLGCLKNMLAIKSRSPYGRLNSIVGNMRIYDKDKAGCDDYNDS
jgi:hypothetical protein